MKIQKKIVDFSLVHVGEVSSSNAMENEGCQGSLNHLLRKKIKIRSLTTDRHTQLPSCERSTLTLYTNTMFGTFPNGLPKSCVRRQRRREMENLANGSKLFHTICGGVHKPAMVIQSCYKRSGYPFSSTL